MEGMDGDLLDVFERFFGPPGPIPLLGAAGFRRLALVLLDSYAGDGRALVHIE